MPRLPEIETKEHLPLEHQDLIEYLAGTRGSVRIPFSVVLNSPEACRRIAHLGSYIRFESSVPQKVLELAVIAVAREFEAGWEWAQHSRLAKEAGASDAAIDAVAHRKPLDQLSDEEAFPIRYARELLQTKRVDDETFAIARERFGDQGVVDLTATVGYYSMMACVLNALEIVPGPELPRLP